jgi:hypothetical protein
MPRVQTFFGGQNIVFRATVLILKVLENLFQEEE